MFTMGNVSFDVVHGSPFHLLLRVICGTAAIGFTNLLYWVEDQFERLSVSDLWHPAIGALGLGIVGFFIPRVWGVGSDTISDILNYNLALKLLILIAVFKALVLVISLGSGTSGGLLAPMITSSAALGGVFVMAMNLIFPGTHRSPGAYALVAMVAVFGAALRATFAFIVFAFEITCDYNAILPLMLGCVIADMIAIRCLPSSILTEKRARRSLSVPEEFEAGVLKIVRVGEVMRTDVQPAPSGMTVAELSDRMARGDPTLNLTQWLPMVGKGGRLAGIVTRGDLLHALETEPKGEITILEAGSNKPVVAYPDELVFDAMFRMLQNNIGCPPVVSRDNPHHMLGYFSRSSILSAWSRQIEEEGVREHGWVKQLLNTEK